MNVHPAAPIGVFDSGLGGLSVVRELRTELPRESILYAADSRFVPYGERSQSEIRERSHIMVGHLIDRGAKLIVVACNTASAASIELLREEFSVPIVGLEPAVKPAVALTTTGKIAVLCTPSTAESARLAKLIERYGSGLEVQAIAVPGLADRIEAGEFDGEVIETLLRRRIDALVCEGTDVVVLGCTHYPFVNGLIAELAGAGVRIVDSGNAVARRAREVLMGTHILAPVGHQPTISIDTTGDVKLIEPIVARMLGESIPVFAIESSVAVPVG